MNGEPHTFLGSALPQELEVYRRNLRWHKDLQLLLAVCFAVALMYLISQYASGVAITRACQKLRNGTVASINGAEFREECRDYGIILP